MRACERDLCCVLLCVCQCVYFCASDPVSFCVILCNCVTVRAFITNNIFEIKDKTIHRNDFSATVIMVFIILLMNQKFHTPGPIQTNLDILTTICLHYSAAPE